jgi:alpha-galactosidase
MSLIKAFFFSLPVVSALEWADGTGKLPALGWNSWNAYGCNIDETVILDAAKAMVEIGFKVLISNAEFLISKYQWFVLGCWL